MDKPSIREDVIRSVIDILGDDPVSREKAGKIADAFTNRRRGSAPSMSRVSPETLASIENDMMKGGMSYARLRKKYGVGMSTLQRVASEMSAKKITVRTTGQTIVA